MTRPGRQDAKTPRRCPRASALGSAPPKRELLHTLREGMQQQALESVFEKQLRAAQERGPAALGRLIAALCKLRREIRSSAKPDSPKDRTP